MAWTPDEREAIVSGFHEATALISDAQFGARSLSGVAKESVIQYIGSLSQELYQLVSRYSAGLPNLALSRCPITGAPMKHSFDAVDLRGLWWRADDPTRPTVEPHAGPTFVALTGAVKLSSPIEYTKFSVHPGPGAPFVIPKLLRIPAVKATLSSMAIGRHTGFAIVYFSSEKLSLPLLERPTIWGTEVTDLNPNYRWDDYSSDDDRVWDFRLEPWLDSGKLNWIAPGDTELKLRTGQGGCPYLNIDGPRALQYVSVGKVTTLSML